MGGIILGTNGTGTVTLSLAGQTLTLDGPLTVNPSGSFTVDSGALVGNTNAVLSGTIGWTAGVLEGILTLAPGSTLNITTGSNHTSAGLHLHQQRHRGVGNRNHCRQQRHGHLQLRIMERAGRPTWSLAYGGAGMVFNNYGTFRKSGGASEFATATFFQPGVVFNQLAGVIDVQNGTNGLQLAIQGGGNFTGGYITTNQFGLTILEVANFTINGTVTGTNTWETDNGNMAGTNVINGALTWLSGVWNGAVVTIASNSTVVMAGGSGQ